MQNAFVTRFNLESNKTHGVRICVKLRKPMYYKDNKHSINISRYEMQIYKVNDGFYKGTITIDAFNVINLVGTRSNVHLVIAEDEHTIDYEQIDFNDINEFNDEYAEEYDDDTDRTYIQVLVPISTLDKL